MKTLKVLRVEKLLTQKELADALGVDERTVYSLEKDSSNIKDSLLKKYMQGFEVKYDDIFLGDEYEINVFEDNLKKSVVSNLG